MSDRHTRIVRHVRHDVRHHVRHLVRHQIIDFVGLCAMCTATRARMRAYAGAGAQARARIPPHMPHMAHWSGFMPHIGPHMCGMLARAGDCFSYLRFEKKVVVVGQRQGET